MIASLTGRILEVSTSTIVLDVCGVGYLVAVPTPLMSSLSVGQEATITTHLVVREDAMTLFGFESTEQKEAFLMLTSVTGVGPKLALSVLSSMTLGALRKAVVSGDVDAFVSIPGIGKRGAQRMILELKERFSVASSEPLTGSRIAEVRDALVGLGYTPAELRDVLDKLDEETSEVEDLVKAALKELSRV